MSDPARHAARTSPSPVCANAPVVTRTTHLPGVLIALLSAAAMPAAAAFDLLYIHRCNASGSCRLLPGIDDASQHLSIIVDHPVTLPAFPYNDTAFNATVSCVRSVFAAYDVDVVTTDPGAVPRREMMLTSTAASLGFSAGIGGITPYYGEPYANAIAVVFADDLYGQPDLLCSQTALQFGSLYGLDHVIHGPDIMSYYSASTRKSFTAVDAQCGEFGPRPCRSNGTPATQDSAEILRLVPGRNGVIFRGLFEVSGPAF